MFFRYYYYYYYYIIIILCGVALNFIFIFIFSFSVRVYDWYYVLVLVCLFSGCYAGLYSCGGLWRGGEEDRGGRRRGVSYGASSSTEKTREEKKRIRWIMVFFEVGRIIRIILDLT